MSRRSHGRSSPRGCAPRTSFSGDAQVMTRADSWPSLRAPSPRTWLAGRVRPGLPRAARLQSKHSRGPKASTGVISRSGSKSLEDLVVRGCGAPSTYTNVDLLMILPFQPFLLPSSSVPAALFQARAPRTSRSTVRRSVQRTGLMTCQLLSSAPLVGDEVRSSSSPRCLRHRPILCHPSSTDKFQDLNATIVLSTWRGKRIRYGKLVLMSNISIVSADAEVSHTRHSLALKGRRSTC